MVDRVAMTTATAAACARLALSPAARPPLPGTPARPLTPRACVPAWTIACGRSACLMRALREIGVPALAKPAMGCGVGESHALLLFTRLSGPGSSGLGGAGKHASSTRPCCCVRQAEGDAYDRGSDVGRKGEGGERNQNGKEEGREAEGSDCYGGLQRESVTAGCPSSAHRDDHPDCLRGELPWPHGTLLVVQRCVPHEGVVHKVYSAGGEVHVAQKQSFPDAVFAERSFVSRGLSQGLGKERGSGGSGWGEERGGIGEGEERKGDGDKERLSGRVRERVDEEKGERLRKGGEALERDGSRTNEDGAISGTIGKLRTMTMRWGEWRAVGVAFDSLRDRMSDVGAAAVSSRGVSGGSGQTSLKDGSTGSATVMEREGVGRQCVLDMEAVKAMAKEMHR